MAYKILFSDIDGTLLDAERTLSEKTIKVLSHLKYQFPIVLISSRMPIQMHYLQEKAGILGMPLIAYNGALVIDKDRKVLRSTEIPFLFVSRLWHSTNNIQEEIYISVSIISMSGMFPNQTSGHSVKSAIPAPHLW